MAKAKKIAKMSAVEKKSKDISKSKPFCTVVNGDGTIVQLVR